MKKQLILVAIVWAMPLLVGNLAPISAGVAFAEEKETRKVPAMRERTYKTLSEAQVLIDPKSVQVEEGEEPPDVKPDPKGAIDMLLKLLDRRGMNSYEIAQTWNTLAFAYYTIDDIPNTIKSYENVLKETITEALELSSLRALFQLYYSQENYKKALEYIDKWQALKEIPDTDVTYIKATVYYQLGDYKKALETALQVEQIAKSQDKQMKEQWWYLQVVLYNETKNYPKVIDVLEQLIKHYPKKQYWMHLAGMYSETDQDDKALSAYYAAYTQGMFTKETEIVMLAQRLLNAEVPYEAAQILEKGFKDGIVEENEKNIKLLATAYTMAQDMGKAIDAWRDATKYADNGELYYRLAQALSQQDRHKEAVVAYQSALDKGGLGKDVPDVNFWMGISLMQLERWDEATKAFREAAKDKDKAKNARQYIQYIASEKKRQEELKKMIEATGPETTKKVPQG
ncbi:MAG: tetratricopeptide repeat protein [Pseudomonadales bacterium]|nr:tetratricopeptide repeat protein [Pseudomonadales bacterium]